MNCGAVSDEYLSIHWQWATFVLGWDGMGDCFGALLVSLMALQLALVDRKPLWPC